QADLAEKAGLDSVLDEPHRISDPDFLHDANAVIPHGILAQRQLGPDFADGQLHANQLQDLLFTLRKVGLVRSGQGRLPPFDAPPPDSANQLVFIEIILDNGIDRTLQFIRVRTLQQKPVDAHLQQLADVTLIVVHRQYNQLYLRITRQNKPARFKTVHYRHLQIDDR